MWYVIQVYTGEEEKTAKNCQKLIGVGEGKENLIQKCFIPYVIRKVRYQGSWHDEKRVLFPGYVFLISQNPDELYQRLRQVPGMTKLLGTGKEIVPISAQEEQLLKKLGGEELIVENSYGIIENEKVIVTDGPLCGMEGYIRKIDRHKRTARLEIEMMGRMVEVCVGLEIVEKR